MPSISKTIHGVLSLDATIVGLVSTRISPYVRNAPDAAVFPSIVFELQSTEIETTSLGDVGRCTTSVRIAALSRDYEEADTIAAAVVDLLAGYSSDTNCIAKISPQSVEHDSDVPYDGSQDLIYRTSAEFRVYHGEAI